MYDWAELRHFRYLLVILEKQGFRVAAEELHTSQPNLTVQARQCRHCERNKPTAPRICAKTSLT